MVKVVAKNPMKQPKVEIEAYYVPRGEPKYVDGNAESATKLHDSYGFEDSEYESDPYYVANKRNRYKEYR